jgi:DNA-directed RNA polymerase subunit H (RpoH/RPB5)
METLRSIRPHEPIRVLEGGVTRRGPETEILTEELKGMKGTILVVRDHSDAIVREFIESMDPEDSGYLFFASELEIDPVNSCMVPKHRIATKEEIDNLAEIRVPKGKLPVLRMLDPIRRWHNFPRGSIVAIDRPDGTYFRVVE